MRLGIYEILENASKLSKKQEKIDYLRANFNPTLGLILQYAFDPNIKWLLPAGKVPYKPSIHDERGVLYREAKKLYLFVEGGNPNLKQTRREFLFIQLMETLDPNDAKLLESIKDKKLPYKGMTKALIKEAYPGLIPDEQNKQTEAK